MIVDSNFFAAKLNVFFKMKIEKMMLYQTDGNLFKVTVLSTSRAQINLKGIHSS